MNQLTRTGRAVASAEARLAHVKALRDEAIRAARRDGTGPNEIAEATGLSRQQVWNIVNTPTTVGGTVGGTD